MNQMIRPRWSWHEGIPDASARGLPTTLALRGASLLTTPAVFDEFARAMDFPSYFGHNWDAFEECFREAAWAVDGQVIQLALESAELVLSRETSRELDTFLSILDGGLEKPNGLNQFEITLWSTRSRIPPAPWVKAIPSLATRA